MSGAYDNSIIFSPFTPFNQSKELTEEEKKELEKQAKAQQDAKILEGLLFTTPKNDLSKLNFSLPSLFTPNFVKEQMNQTGLVIEKTTPENPTPAPVVQEVAPVQETQQVQPEVVQQAEKKETEPQEQQKPQYQKGSDFDSAIMRYHGLESAEEFAALPEEEKQRLADEAFKGMIDDFNRGKKPEEQITQMDQYLKYIKRDLGTEQAGRLARAALNTMGEEDIVRVFKEGGYSDEQIKNIMQGVYAQNVGTSFTQKGNYLEAVDATTQYSVENQEIAAEHLLDARAEWHADGVRTYVQKACEEAQNVLAQNTGRFGMNEDGTINKEAQIETFGAINESKYESVLNTAAANIYQLDASNYEAAKQITYNTGCQSAIDSIKTEPPIEKETKQSSIEIEEKTSAKVSTSSNVDVSQKAEEVKAALINNTGSAARVDLSNCTNRDILAIFRELKSNKDKEKFIEQYPEYASVILAEDTSFVSEKTVSQINDDITIINMGTDAQEKFIETDAKHAAGFKKYFTAANQIRLEQALEQEKKTT